MTLQIRYMLCSVTLCCVLLLCMGFQRNPSLDRVLKDLKSPSAKVRRKAVKFLCRDNIRLLDFSEQIAPLLQDKDPDVVGEAVKGIGEVGNLHSIQPLSEVAQRDAAQRLRVVRALHKMDNPSVIPILEEYQNDPNKRIREDVGDAIDELRLKYEPGRRQNEATNPFDYSEHSLFLNTARKTESQ